MSKIRPMMHYWTPRAAGTSIWHAARRGTIDGKRFESLRCGDHAATAKWRPDIPLVTFQHKTIDRLLADGNVTQEWIDKAFIFTFVRDPLERLESIWRHLKQGHARQREAVRAFTSFAEFAWHVAETSWHELENYIDYARPQITWSNDSSFVGRFSHLEEDFSKLTNCLGIKAPKLFHENASKKILIDMDQDLEFALRQHYAADYDLLERIGY